MDGDPFERVLVPLSTVRARVVEVLGRHGLGLVHFAVAPNADPAGPHAVYVFAVLARDTDDGDAQFEEVLRSARLAELEQQASEVRRRLQERLDGIPDGGFLDDS